MARVDALALLNVALFGAGYEHLAECLDARRFPPPGQMIDVGTHCPHLRGQDAGTPDVVIEAGSGDWSAAWVRKRGGADHARRRTPATEMGFSEPLPRTAGVFVGELHTLLGRGNVPGPYLPSGHCLGGLTVRLYARRYPRDIAGAVLIGLMHHA